MTSTTPLAQGNFPRGTSLSFRAHRSRAFTLIEILVSLTITLMMMGAVVSLFQIISDSVSGSRSVIEVTERLRSCRNRLQADLQGVTATMKPPLRPENDEGYFEAIEGVKTDAVPGLDFNSAASPQPALDSRYGDTDDILMFTTRTSAEPFVGKLNGGTFESQIAEVAWFMVPDTNSPPTYTLYRRVRLVSPLTAVIAANQTDDISMHAEGANFKANTLGDLTKPENRWLHTAAAGGGFPYRMTTPVANLPFTLASGRLADDVILTNVLAFDVQLYDPGAPIYQTTTVPILAIEPRDLKYATMIGSATPAAFGAYADLGYGVLSSYTASGTNPTPSFSKAPLAKCGNTAYPFAYDTWSLHYENDGVQQASANSGPDLGTNGLDDAIAGTANGIVDDQEEFDTLPPYLAQLRGIRVTIRVYEPSSQQVREVTVEQDFLPE